MPIINIKGVGQVRFPDSMSDNDIVRAIEHEVIPQYEAQIAPAASIGEAFKGGAKRFGETVLTGLTGFGDAEEAAKAGLARQQAITERPGASLEKVKSVYEEQGLLPAAGEAISQVPKFIAEQTPNLAAMAGGARLGATAGSVFGPAGSGVGAVIGGGLGMFTPSFLSQRGSFLERQAAEGKPVSGSSATLAAVPAAVIDVFADRIAFGKLLGISPTKLGTKAADKMLTDSLLKTGAKGAGKILGAEIPNEVAQQMFERAQAGLSLTDEDARKEYIDTAYQTALMAPVGGVSNVMQQRSVQSAHADNQKKIQEELNAINAERARIDAITQEAQATANAAMAEEARRAQAEVDYREQKLREAAAISTSDPTRPFQDIINEVTGVNQAPAGNTSQGFVRAWNEPSGVRVADPQTGLERELSMGEAHVMRNPKLFTEDAKQTLMLPPGEQKALIVFPDGSVGTEEDVQAHAKSLPEKEQTAFLSKLYGYEPQKVEEAKKPVLGLPHYAGEKLISFPDGSLGTQKQAEDLISLLPEEKQSEARATLLGMKPEVATTKLDKTTLTSLVPSLPPHAGIFKRLLNLNVDTDENLAKMHKELDKLGEKHAVNEVKLKEIEDAYKQQTEQREASKRDFTGVNLETSRTSLRPTGERLGGGSAAGVAGTELGGVAPTGESVREPAVGTSGVNAPLETEAAQVEEAPLPTHEEAVTQALQEAAAPTPTPVQEAKPTVEELKLTKQALKQMPGSPAQKQTLAKLAKVKQAKVAAKPTPLTSLVQATLETNEAKKKDAAKKKKGFAKKEIDDRISNKAAISSYIDDNLTAEEENLVTEELGNGDVDVGKAQLIKHVAESMAGKAIKGISLAIRNLIKRIQAGLMAFAVAMNFNPNIPVIDVGIPTQVQVSAYEKQVNVKGNAIGETAQRIANHVLNTGNGKAFIVADKPNQMLYAFDKDGHILGKTVMLTGEGVGDVRAKLGKSPWEYSHAQRITPAGKFTGQFRYDDHYGSLIALEETRDGTKAVLAVHFAPFVAGQDRAGRLASPTVEDNRISQGCLNVPKAFYDSTLKDNFQGQSQVYIMPDMSDAISYFGVQDTVTKTVYQPGTEPISGGEKITQEASARKEDVDAEAKFEAAKDTFGAYLRQSVGGAMNITPEEQVSLNEALAALADIMYFIIRRGAKSTGHAIQQARKALVDRFGDVVNNVSQQQFNEAYTAAVARRAEEQAPVTARPTPARRVSATTRPDGTAIKYSKEPKKSVLEDVRKVFNGEDNDWTEFSDKLGALRDKIGLGVVSKRYTIERKALDRGIPATSAKMQGVMRGDLIAQQADYAVAISHAAMIKGDLNFLPSGMVEAGIPEGVQSNMMMISDSYRDLVTQATQDLGSEELAYDMVSAGWNGPRYASLARKNAEIDAQINHLQETKPAHWKAKVTALENDKAYIGDWTDSDKATAAEAQRRYGPQLQEIKDLWNTFRGRLLKSMVDSGLYSEAQAEAYLENMDYVPFYRLTEESLEALNNAPVTGTSLRNLGKEYKLKGSEKTVADPLENLWANVSWMMQRAIKNNAANHLADLIENVGEGRYAESWSRNGHIGKLTDNEKKKLHHVTIFKDGEAKEFVLDDPNDMAAFASNPVITGAIWDVMGLPARALRHGVTMMPQFVGTQAIEDPIRAAIVSGNKAGALKTMKDTWTSIYKNQFTAEHSPGADALYSAGIIGQKDVMSEQEVKDIYMGENKKGWRKGLFFFERLAQGSDLGAREAIYNNAVKELTDEGYDAATAHSLAVSRALQYMPHQQVGTSRSMAYLRRMIPFVNSPIQGLARDIAAARGRISGITPEEGKRRIKYTMAKYALVTAVYAAMVSGDDEYENLTDDQKDNNFYLGGIRFPVPQELRPLKVLIERGTRSWILNAPGADIESYDIAAAVMKKNFEIVSGLIMPIPTAARPFIENTANYDFYHGRPVVGASQINKEPAMQYTDSTSEIAKSIGAALNYSPIKIDHFLSGWFGYAGQTVRSATDALLGEGKPSASINEIPVVGTFATPEFGAGPREEAYSLLNKVAEVKATMKAIREEGDIEKLRAYMTKNRGYIGAEGMINAMHNQITNIRRLQGMITKSDLSPEEKRARIDELKQNELMALSRVHEVHRMIIEANNEAL